MVVVPQLEDWHRNASDWIDGLPYVRSCYSEEKELREHRDVILDENPGVSQFAGHDVQYFPSSDYPGLVNAWLPWTPHQAEPAMSRVTASGIYGVEHTYDHSTLGYDLTRGECGVWHYRQDVSSDDPQELTRTSWVQDIYVGEHYCFFVELSWDSDFETIDAVSDVICKHLSVSNDWQYTEPLPVIDQEEFTE